MIKRCMLLGLCVMLQWLLPAFAEPLMPTVSERIDNAEQKLEITRSRLAYDQSQLAATVTHYKSGLKQLAGRDISKDEVVQARLDQAKAQAKLQSLRISIVEAHQAVTTISTQIRRIGEALQEATLSPSADQPIQTQIQRLKDELSLQQKWLALEQERVRVLNKSMQVAQEQEKLQDAWLKTLKTKQLEQHEQAILNQLEAQKKQLQAEQHEWLITLSALNQSTNALQQQVDQATTGDARTTLMQTLDVQRMARIEAEEQSNLKQVALMLIGIKQQLASIAKSQATTSVYTLRQINTQISTVIDDLDKLKKLHTRKLALLELRQEIAEAQFNRGVDSPQRQKQKLKLYEQLKHDYLAQSQQTDALMTLAKQYQDDNKQALTKALARRQELPSFSAVAWERLAMKIAQMPRMAVVALDSLKTQLVLSMKNMSMLGLVFLASLQAVLFLVWLEGRTVLSKLSRRVKTRRLALGGETVFVMLELIKRNWLGLLLTVSFFSWFVFSEVPFKSYGILLWLILVWSAFKWGIGLARLTLLEGTAQITGHDVILYRGLKWSMVLGGIVATLTVLAHQLPVTFEVSDFFNRILMVFFVGLGAFLLLRLRIVPELLAPHLDKSRPYVRHLIRVLSILIPLAMLTNAVIGLAGYVQLAWTVSKHVMVFVLVLAVYMLTRGMMIDLMASLASFTIRHMRNGWLLTEAILKPLDRLIRLALLFLSLWFVFNLYGWDESTVAANLVHDFLKLQLFNVGDSPITPLTLVQLAIIAVVLYWFARWSKEFAYRWLFAKIKDVGMRNSMAALFQYTVVLVSSFISLQVLKIDWTGLKFVLVAFAAGIGFGLRDTANNLVSGLLLLFERPVRRGDLVTVGDHEGEVVHVGIRSLVLHTWDHMDVLVPNSEIYSKSFVNWTRQDPIIRSTFTIRVQRDDDPRKVRMLIESILQASPDVLNEPASEVFFIDVADDLINIEVRYHINLQYSESRVKVRSDLMFAIWRQFKEAGIRAPYHQQDIHLRSVPDNGRIPLHKPFS